MQSLWMALTEGARVFLGTMASSYLHPPAPTLHQTPEGPEKSSNLQPEQAPLIRVQAPYT